MKPLIDAKQFDTLKQLIELKVSDEEPQLVNTLISQLASTEYPDDLLALVRSKLSTVSQLNYNYLV